MKYEIVIEYVEETEHGGDVEWWEMNSEEFMRDVYIYINESRRWKVN